MNRNCRIAVLAATLLAGSLTLIAQDRVIGYYPMWSRGNLPATQVKFNYLTHLCHAFAWPLADGTLASYEAVVDTAIINATHRAGRKILISLGGAAESTNFPSVVADTARRHAFVRNIVSYLKTYGYDGADLDWEGPSNATERLNEAILMRELHTAFLAENPDWLITMAVGVSNWSGQWHNFDSLKVYVDWFNAMCYDFHGSWTNHAGHNAPLYAPPTDYDGCDDQGITYLAVTRSIPRSQITLGMPFYAKEFVATAMYAPSTGETDIAYPEVVYRIGRNWAYVWDTVSQVPYLVAPSKTRVVTFDDSTSLTKKCQYAKAKQLSGVMIWEITQDVIGSTQPLMDAVGIAMTGTSGVAGPENRTAPEGFALEQNYPNPFNPTTTIEYSIGGDVALNGANFSGAEGRAHTNVRLVVYDILGREVAVLVNERNTPGRHEVQFNAHSLSSGVYVYRLTAGGSTATRMMTLLR